MGKGKDGYIIDTISCGNLSKENGYVSKIFTQPTKVNVLLHNKLKEIDPNNERFNRYYFPDYKDCNVDGLKETITCIKQNIDITNIVFQKYLVPFNSNQMTKAQYRYLRDSLKILHANNISHGDLPENVMLDPVDHLPRIIDWENANLDCDARDKTMDYNAFLTHYRVPNIIFKTI